MLPERSERALLRVPASLERRTETTFLTRVPVPRMQVAPGRAMDFRLDSRSRPLECTPLPPPRAHGDAVDRRAAHNTHVCELKLPALARPLARQLPAAPTQGRIAAGVHDR